MEVGKMNYIFNRAWSWMSKIITIFNFLMITYLVIKENALVLIAIPVALICWGALTFLDLKYVLPKELQYGFRKNPEWVLFTKKIERELKEIKEAIK